MSEGEKVPLQREGVLFFGAVGAGLSHEISNILNIINELTGLQQDIIAAAQEGSAGVSRLTDLAARIKSQVVRAEELNRSLHGLSHSVDEVDVVFDVGAILRLFGSLAARSARLAEVELQVRLPEVAITHRGDPFALLMALHTCLRTALGAAASKRRIELRAEDHVSGPRVMMSSGDTLPDLESDVTAAGPLRLATAALGATAFIERTAGTDDRLVLELTAAEGAAGGAANGKEAED